MKHPTLFLLGFMYLINWACGVKTRSVENCGVIPPTIRNYIYGGKSTIIEQWPWQVITISTGEIKFDFI